MMVASLYMMLLLIGIFMLFRREWKASIWWIAFYSAAIYGMPVVVGEDLFGAALSDDVSAVMLLVMAATLIASVTVKPAVFKSDRLVPGARYFVIVAVLASLVSFGALVAIHGTSIFFVHKTESGIGGYFYILWRLSASYALLACFMARRYRLAILAALPLLASLFAGDRTAVGLTLIAILWMGLRGGHVSGPRLLAITASALLIGSFLFFGKTFQGEWATGTFTSLPDLAHTLAKEGGEAVTSTEPFATIGVFNALVKSGVSPPDSLLLDVGAQFLVVPSYFGFESTAFNDFFQPILFPGRRKGSLAYSYWGEGYSRGGWPGVAVFLLVFMVVLRGFDRLAAKSSFPVRIFAYLGGAYWAFYIHRNSMVSIIAYERQIVLYVLMLAVGAHVFRLVNRRVMR